MAALTAAPAGGTASPFVGELSGGRQRLELSVPGVHCASCIRRVEEGLRASPGVTDARVNLSTRKVVVTWRTGAQTAESIVSTLERAGFEATPFDMRGDDSAGRSETRDLLRCLGVAAFAAGNVMLLSVAVWAGLAGSMGYGTRTVLYVISGIIAVPATLYAGRPFYRSAWKALRHGRANMDVPISLAVLLALVLSIYQTAIGAPYAYFDASVSLLFFLLIGRALDQALRERTRDAASSLLALQSATASRRAADGTVSLVGIRDLEVGDIVLIAAGERVPVDAVVESGRSQVDMSLVSGETLPHPAEAGSELGAGTLNMTGQLVVRVRARAENSLIAELTRMMEAAEQSRSRMTLLADKAARLYVPVVHTAALGVFLYWLLWSDGGFMSAMHNAIATLIITCPCGLGLAVPATQMVAVGRLFRAGVIAKSGAGLERLAEVDVAVLDKTGTLTLGRPVLLDREAVDPGLLADAARLARASRHPLARALAEAAGIGPLADDVREEPGFGIEGAISGAACRLGRRDWVTGSAADGEDAGILELWFSAGSRPAVRFRFADKVRDDAAALVAGLRRRGIRPILLSGDRAASAEALARSLAIAEWRGEVDPIGKTEVIRQLAGQGSRVLMIGDGLNDAASLSLAHASIAPARAADAAQNAADFVVTGERLSPVLVAIDIARISRRRVLQGFAFAAVYNVFALPFGAAGLVTPVISAISMSASSILVMLNALRPMRSAAS